MERAELETFLTLAEELHFGRTADRMRLSRSRVSQLVARLERRIGGPLFIRTSRTVALTAVGRRLRDDLAPAHQAITEALERARAATRGVTSVLHVGFATPLTGEIALAAAEVLRTDHPELAVEICEIPLADPYGPLREREFDVQIGELPRNADDLGHGPALLREEHALAIAAGHTFAGRGALTVEDLADVPLLGVATTEPARGTRTPTRTPSGREIPRGPVVTNMQEALMLVAAGHGAFLVPAHSAAYYARPGVSYVPVLSADPVDYGLVWRADSADASLARFARAAGRAARAHVARGSQPTSAGANTRQSPIGQSTIDSPRTWTQT
ncbi:MAG: LysR family transcriptional regulator [Streptomycetaceae bacterium]|nr:LysR family transcriptional regulator [Streptomycetaceae bacterium]